MLQQHTSGIHIISLLALLSIRVASVEACPLRLWSHNYQPYVPRLGVPSHIVVQPSSVSQQHTAGFIALSRCSPSCLSGTLRERLAPRGTGPTSTCTTSSELGVTSGIIIQPSSVWQHHTAGFIALSLCSLSCPSGPRQTLSAPQSTGSTCPSTTFHTLGINSGLIIQPSSVLHQYIARSLASHSCLSRPWQMRLAPWALVLRVPALRFLSWEFTLASSYNPRQRCYGALQGFMHSLSARTPVYQGCLRRGLHQVALALRAPALRSKCWELSFASSFIPLQNATALCRVYCVLSLPSLLSIRHALDAACSKRHWSSALRLAP